MPVFSKVHKEDLAQLREHGFYEVLRATQHEIVRMRRGSSVLVLFASGRLVVQGALAEETVKLIRELRIGTPAEQQFKEMKGIIIGSDEALKGDTFGGIVVAAVKADDTERKRLIEIGVADSKTLSDDEVLGIAKKLEKSADFEIKNYYPEEYNAFKGSVTQLLNKLHKECHYYLKPGRHVVDKYPGCTVGDVIETKADAHYAEVAAASILARAHALRQIDELSKRAGFKIPKGSTHVQDALLELKKRRLNAHEFVKISFSNVKKALEL